MVTFYEEKPKVSIIRRILKYTGIGLFTYIGGNILWNYFDSEIKLKYHINDKNKFLVSKIPSLKEPYRPTPYLFNRLAEISYCALVEPKPHVDIIEERMYTSTGDSLELDWGNHFTMSKTKAKLQPTTKIALVLGPVNGSNRCNYTSHMMQELAHRGFRVVLVHYRNFKFYGSHHETTPKVGQID